MRRMFGRGRGRGFRKRTVAWIPGFSGMDDAAGTSTRIFPLTGPIPGTTNTWGVATVLVAASDLTLHGGEGAVLRRLVGNLWFSAGRKNAGAGLLSWTFGLRVTIYLHQVNTAGNFNDAFTRSNDLQSENILFCRDVIVPFANFPDSSVYSPFSDVEPGKVLVNVKAKRRVFEDKIIVMSFQTCAPAGTTSLDMKVTGEIRTLVQRPR